MTKRMLEVLMACLFGLCVLSNSALSQSKISVVDHKHILETWEGAVLDKTIFTEEERTVQTLLTKNLELLQKCYAEVISGRYCFAPQQLEKISQELIAQQNALASAESILTDSIPIARNRITTLIAQRLNIRLDAMAASGKYGVLLRQSQILYREAGYPVYFVSILPTKQEKHHFQLAIHKEQKALQDLINRSRSQLEALFSDDMVTAGLR